MISTRASPPRHSSNPAGVGPADVAAVHIMINETLTGTTYDIDGGQQLVPASSEEDQYRGFSMKGLQGLSI